MMGEGGGGDPTEILSTLMHCAPSATRLVGLLLYHDAYTS